MNLVNCFNKYVDHFEILSYRPIVNRQKRSIIDTYSDVFFHAYNRFSLLKYVLTIFFRTFHLKLRPIDVSNGIFSDDHIIDLDGEHYHLIKPYDFLYEGNVVGELS